MADRIVGIAEAAERLQLHPQTLQKMCRAGRSPVKCAKRDDSPKSDWVFSDNDLNDYISGLFNPQAVGQ